MIFSFSKTPTFSYLESSRGGGVDGGGNEKL